MLESSTTKFCMSACIFIMLISLSMNLVVGLNVFGTMAPSPLLNGSTTDMTTINSQGKTYNLTSILSNNLISILTLSGSTALFVLILINCIRTGSYSILAPVLFTLIFWNSWIINFSFFLSSPYFNNLTMIGIYSILSFVMVFLFLGAVIGMIGGND